MDIYNKEFGDLFSENKLNILRKQYFDDLIKNNNINNNTQNESDNNFNKIQETFNDNDYLIINNQNKDEIIDEEKVLDISSTKEKKIKTSIMNNNSITQTKTRDETKTKRGRRKKDSQEEGGHTNNSPDNLRCVCGTSFMKVLYLGLKVLCKKYGYTLYKPNFKSQFGWNILHYQQFINAKIYQIFSYQNEENKDIIKKMYKIQKDSVFIYIMNCKFEYLYNKYIKGENGISLDEKEDFTFMSFSDVVEYKKTELRNKKISNEAINDYICKFKEQSENFIKDIKGEGKLIKRKIQNKNELNCNYEIMLEIEELNKK